MNKLTMFSRAGLNSRLKSAFTLIELLVVIGIISVLAGGIGIALQGGDSSSAIRAGQSTIFSMVAGARGQAILNQSISRLLVYADTTDTTTNLCYLQIVRSTDSGVTWDAIGDGTKLPNGVYIVPPAGMSLFTGTAPYSNVSVLSSASAFSVSSKSIQKVYYIEFNQLGTPSIVLTPDSYGTFVLSTAVPTPVTLVPQFNNPENIRGLLLRQLGSVTLMNSKADF